MGVDNGHNFRDPAMLPGSLPVEGFAHRKPSNSCMAIKMDLVQCIKESPCFAKGRPFDECIHSKDAEFITDECLVLKKGYAQCRRNLMKPELRLRGNQYSR